MIAVTTLVSEECCGLIGIIQENINISVIIVVTERGTAANLFGKLCQPNFGGGIGKVICAVLSVRIAEKQVRLRISAI